MPTLHDDILLAVAGFSKLKDITAMMRTSKAVHELIVRHERSIVKNAVKTYTGGDSSLIPPRGAICSSHSVEREYLYSKSFDILHELDIRTSRTETLLSEGQPLRNKIDSVFSITGAFLDLPKVERDILMARVKEAFKLVDRLADCAADVMSEWMEPADKTTAQQLDGDESVLEVHSRQLDFIRSLSPLDLAYLFQLVTWAGQAYAAQNPALMADVDCWERLLAFKEATLRHGTIMLWAVFEPAKVTPSTNADPTRRKPATELARFAENNIRLILEEIRIYQSTETSQNRLPPGLHMTMSKTFVEKTGRPSTRQAIEMEHMVLNDIRVD
ncbi:hypothetical protein SMACR_00252 [Sordaria macrospora]|uniref:WGS project CABT00000000 data, contig 2.1 n=2 Tax=Sordaria macrospora TaxID=5147 RepID=F7VKK9_SORMK|nr:uncharacterized protein SMAC_00252 [Sordaria macrospora k-hell]KAA8636825.1 hypothetical protein SMACR_00252 [Sordaria macrospora]WPJ58996.1 hypothetical protein SMAC4_00252 [Sordaria macrospora]CCC06036.1 unnamed protein product [Sordaria macrospora k-hell]